MTIRTNNQEEAFLFRKIPGGNINPCVFRLVVSPSFYYGTQHPQHQFDFKLEQNYGFLAAKKTSNYMFSLVGARMRMSYAVEPKKREVARAAKTLFARYPYEMVLANIRNDREFTDMTTRNAHEASILRLSYNDWGLSPDIAI